jgi:hypothetical protein
LTLMGDRSVADKDQQINQALRNPHWRARPIGIQEKHLATVLTWKFDQRRGGAERKAGGVAGFIAETPRRNCH